MNTQSTPPNIQENPPVNEDKVIAEVIQCSIGVLDKETDPVQRQQHPKSHGCVKAEFIVEDVPEECRFGIFREPRRYPAFVRFSNGSLKPQQDSKGDVRGMAIKLLGVEGEKLLEEERQAQTQDFILINHPVLFLKDAQDSLDFAKAVEMAKKMPFKPLKPLPLLLMYVPSHLKQFKILKTIQKKTVTNQLQIQYWSTTPYKLGHHAIKFSVKPSVTESNIQIAPNLESENFLREVMVERLSRQEVCFDFLVQLQKNPDQMPVEDATVEWSETDSPFIKVANIRIPMQTFDTEARRRFDENLSFNPWHALVEHQPLGGINRVRKYVYQAITATRHNLNKVTVQEPTMNDFNNPTI
ncbi:catalase family protein [Nostoc sp.]|uniref:catalase family protein n=1 Tax=Nostoc sp. TaxID=1180 RepID=UPI002FF590AD